MVSTHIVQSEQALAVSQSAKESVAKAVKVMRQTSARFSAFSASNFLDIAGSGEFQEQTKSRGQPQRQEVAPSLESIFLKL